MTTLKRLMNFSGGDCGVVNVDGYAWATDGNVLIRLGDASKHDEFCSLIMASMNKMRAGIEKMVPTLTSWNPKYELTIGQLYGSDDLSMAVRMLNGNAPMVVNEAYLKLFPPEVELYGSSNKRDGIVVLHHGTPIGKIMPFKDLILDLIKPVENESEWAWDMALYQDKAEDIDVPC